MNDHWVNGFIPCMHVPRGDTMGNIVDAIPCTSSKFVLDPENEVHAVLEVVESDSLRDGSPGAVFLSVTDENDDGIQLFGLHLDRKHARVLAAMLIEASSD